MSNIKILSIFGTRPEAIKMAPLIKELQLHSNFETKVCVTAQHREILDQVLDTFMIKPDFDLDIMENKQSLTKITKKVLGGLEKLFKDYKPDMVLVHGDTTTTFAASLAAFYSRVKIGHVEAGLRTFDKYFPYPEEINRKLTGALADLHFAPTQVSKNNLLNEGISEDLIYVTGNTVIDAMKTTVKKDYFFEEKKLNEIDYENKRIIMVTSHRRENWGIGIEHICKALKEIIDSHDDVEIVYIVHPNPLVKDTVENEFKDNTKVHLINPLGTNDTHNLMNKVYLIMTDSGGIQEEAPNLGKPVLVLRGVTERPEAVQAGTVKLVGTDTDMILQNANNIINNKECYNKMSNAINPYGDGYASQRIVQAIKHYFNLSEAPKEFYYRNI